MSESKTKKLKEVLEQGLADLTTCCDYGKEYMRIIPGYNGFRTKPAHIGNAREVNGLYHIYEPISYHPSDCL